MADYQARINLLVTGQNRLRDVQTQLQQIEQTITDLERRQRVAGAAAGRSRTLARAIGGTEQPRGPGGQFAADPNRQQRFAILAAQRRGDVEERLSRILGARARAEADSINTRIAGQNRVNRRIEAQITLESRLNAAVDLYRTNLQKFERAGGTTNVALNRQVTTIRDAFAAFEAGGSRNLSLVRSLATELGRVGEAQREINRTQSLGSKGFEAGRRLQERLTVVGQTGVTDPAQIRRARSLATQTIAASRTGDQQAYQEALRRATAATARLERESLATARALKEASAGYATSPIRGTPTMPGSPAFLDARARRRSAVRGRIGGALSGAAIGGAFPLLFGQSGGAALGGAVGGLAGGLLGPGGSFAGSLVGTILGDIAAKGNVVKKLGEDIGFSAQQTKTLETAFKQAGSEFDKFQASVQNIRGLGLDIEAQAESIKLVSTLTEKYGGTIDKITNAFTSALESGKVTQATLNQLTSQGIPIQQALADKYKVSRSELLQMAKDGKISVQDLTNTLIEQANTSVKASEKQKSGFDILKKASKDLGTAISDLGSSIVTSLTPAFNWLSGALGGIISLAAQAVQGIANALKGGTPETVLANARARQRLAAEGGPSTGTRYLTPKQTARLQQLQKEEQAKIPKVTEKVGPIDVTGVGQLPPSGGGGKSATDKAARDAQRAAEEKQRLDALLKQLQEEIRIRTETIGLEKSLVEARADQNDQLEAQIQSSIRLLDIGSKQAVIQKNFEAGKIGRAEYTLRLQLLELDRTEDQIKYEEDLNRIFKERYGITDAIARLARESRAAAFGGTGATGTFRTDLNLMPGLTEGTLGEEYDAVKSQLDELLKVENQVISAADTIGQAFGNSFKGVIDGSMSAREALAGFFNSVADSFADMAAQMISQWIRMQIIGLAQSLLPGGSTVFPQGVGNFSGAFGPASSVSFNPGAAFGGFMANGGSVSGGQSYIVGERGPELFVPGRSGTIVPNDKMGGGGDVNVVVNVDAKGTSVEGNESEGKQLGRLISAAVQSELVKQQRPGGLLAR